MVSGYNDGNADSLVVCRLWAAHVAYTECPTSMLLLAYAWAEERCHDPVTAAAVLNILIATGRTIPFKGKRMVDVLRRRSLYASDDVRDLFFRAIDPNANCSSKTTPVDRNVHSCITLRFELFQTHYYNCKYSHSDLETEVQAMRHDLESVYKGGRVNKDTSVAAFFIVIDWIMIFVNSGFVNSRIEVLVDLIDLLVHQLDPSTLHNGGHVEDFHVDKIRQIHTCSRRHRFPIPIMSILNSGTSYVSKILRDLLRHRAVQGSAVGRALLRIWFYDQKMFEVLLQRRHHLRHQLTIFDQVLDLAKSLE